MAVTGQHINGDSHEEDGPPAKRVKSEYSADSSSGTHGEQKQEHDDDEDLLATARLLDGEQEENDSKKKQDSDSQNNVSKQDSESKGTTTTKQESKESAAEDERRRKKQQEEEEEDDQVHKQRAAKLKFLLQRSGVYSQIMGEKMDKERKARAEASKAAEKSKPESGDATNGNAANGNATNGEKASSSSSSSTGRNTRAGDAQDKQQQQQQHEARPKRANAGKKKKDEEWEVSTYLSKDDLKGKSSADASPAPSARPAHSRQPALVTGAELRPYQLDGFEWLVSLYENGLNGILADEMGLGKTLQTISFLAHLRGKGVWGPFLIVAPLSTIANWVNEFERFTPGIPAMMYHASGKQERAQLRKQIKYPTTPEERRAFPVVVTSFEIAMMDRQQLSHLKWKYIVVDEGHRLKNMNCRLIQELKRFNSAQRLILTGTPLHNNLKELWSLLNFILPDIFDDLETFEKW